MVIASYISRFTFTGIEIVVFVIIKIIAITWCPKNGLQNSYALFLKRKLSDEANVVFVIDSRKIYKKLIGQY